LNYAHHVSKTDKTQLSHKTDIGYELTAMLAVDAESGKPMGLLQAHLKTAYGFESTSDTPLAAKTSHLAQVAMLLEDAKNMNLVANSVTIIDCEANSVFHMRQWATAGILLSGLFVLLQILDYLDHMGGDDLKQIKKLRSLLKKCLPNFIKNVQILLPKRAGEKLAILPGS
jgi:hypothetical protein